MNKVGSTKTVNFMTPWAEVIVLGRGHISCIVKMHSFFNKPSTLIPGIDQTKQVCGNDEQGRVYQNCKFHDPLGRGSCARAWSYKSYSEYALFL